MTYIFKAVLLYFRAVELREGMEILDTPLHMRF